MITKLLKRIMLKILNSKFGKLLSDENYLKIKYRIHVGKILNLKNPQTFSEKLQWLKLHPVDKAYSYLADKIEMKKYVAEKMGSRYVAKLYDVWESANEIDISDLPDKFVLKCNHDSGSAVVIDKSTYDKEKTEKFFAKRLKRNYFYTGREWSYKEINPKVFAEEFLNLSGDVKMFCFDGEPKIVICYGEKGSRKMTYYDLEWNKLPCYQKRNPVAPDFEKPACLENMIECAKKLSYGISFVRVDFMLTTDGFRVSEITFFPSSGFAPIIPEKYEMLFGSLINI